MKFYSIKNKGFSLIEIMVSGMVMLIVVISLTTTLLSFIKIGQQNNDMIIANQIIKSALENSTSATADIVNEKPSSYLLKINGDKNISQDSFLAVDIKNVDLKNNATQILVIVSKGQRSGTQFLRKRFLSQASKVFYQGNE